MTKTTNLSLYPRMLMSKVKTLLRTCQLHQYFWWLKLPASCTARCRPCLRMCSWKKKTSLYARLVSSEHQSRLSEPQLYPQQSSRIQWPQFQKSSEYQCYCGASREQLPSSLWQRRCIWFRWQFSKALQIRHLSSQDCLHACGSVTSWQSFRSSQWSAALQASQSWRFQTVHQIKALKSLKLKIRLLITVTWATLAFLTTK